MLPIIFSLLGAMEDFSFTLFIIHFDSYFKLTEKGNIAIRGRNKAQWSPFLDTPLALNVDFRGSDGCYGKLDHGDI